MMNRYVLRTTGLILILLAILSGRVLADFFNDTWYEESRRDRERSTAFVPGGESADGESVSGERGEEPGYYVRLKTPDDVFEPIVTVTDSIDIDRGVIIHRREVPGLKTEKYYFVPLDEYLATSRDRDRDRLWAARKAELMKEWQTTEETGLADLDLVVPVGRRFERLVGGTTNINIDGSQSIEFSGRSEYDEGVIATATNTNNKFPSLKMTQTPRFNIRGNIGDRLKIDIKQDSEDMFSNLEENISIKYEGRDNDIIKYIEAGNTSLNLPGATFAGYSGTHQGLFGIRAEAQLGPIELTTIASQEKGESSSKSFRGSAEESSTQIRDYQYKANTYFFLDFFYREQFALSRDDFSRILYDPADSVEVFEVYVNDGDNLNDTDEATLAYPGVAWPMNMFTGEEDSSEAGRVEGFYHRMDPSQYYISRELGFIQFSTRIPDGWTVGVYMRTKGDPGRGIPAREFGRLAYDSTKPGTTKNVFKLIKRKSQRPTDTDIWDLEWKNVYDLGQRNIDLDGLEIKIYMEATDGVSRDKQDGVPFIEILGLDRVDETGNPNSSPDNIVDFNRGLVDRYRGEIIFPLLKPFDSPLPPAGVDSELAVKVPQIYDSANQNERMEATKYYIEVKTSQRSATIQLDSFMGIIENSEAVYLGSRKLTRGTDYRIDYFSGIVTLLNEDAMSPNAELKIDYQPQGGIQEMQKTLFGIRGEYDLWGDSRMGAVFLFNNESTRDKRVRLGSEPSRNMLFDVDADLNFTPRFLTTAVDMLPGVVADTDSRVRLQAEYARSMPNMNTHGEVYIDDFEGSQDTSISIMRTNWNYGSRPDPSTPAGANLKSRGILQWYNPWDRIPSEDIWGKKRQTAAGENTVHVLSLAYGKPDEDGVTDGESYAGITTSFYGSGIDLSRARFLEVWVKGGKGELKIDLGSISEDYFPYDDPNSLLDTEDRPIPGLGQGDGVLTEDEDTGLDGLFDNQEEGYSSTNRDPAGDNFGYNEKDKNDYSRINGTEGNAADPDRMGYPDTEDINRNGILDTRNSYYEYTIDLESQFAPYLVPDTLVDPGKPDSWRMFRIPLWDNLEAVEAGTPDAPDSTLIEFARLWVTGADTAFIQIAEINIVESNWLEEGVVDEDGNKVYTGGTLSVTTVNTNENEDYDPPPGVSGELDRTNKIRQKEQSIVIGVEDLEPGNAGIIYRTFERMDFTDYTSLNLFVHGADEFPAPPATVEATSDYEFIARFGADKNNYYEYRAPIFQGWASANNVVIDFATCTEIKLMDEYGFDPVAYATSLLDSLTQTMPDSLAQSVADSLALVAAETMEDSLFIRRGNKIYGIKGSPSLNNVRVVQFGFRNNGIETLTTEIWLDELRMNELRDMDGSASRVALETDLAGFIQVRGKVQQQSDDFHGMNAKKGSGSSQTSWDSNVRINLDRFTPKRWNLSLSVSADLRESEALPRLKSGSDIILPEAQRSDYRTYSTARSGRVSYKKGHDETKTGIEGFVTRWALEKVSLDYDWGEQYSDDPGNGTRDANNRQLQVRYDVAPKQRGFMPLGWMPLLPTSLGRAISNATFNYTPSALNYTYKFNEKNTYVTDIDGNVEEPVQIKTANDVTNLTYKPFNAINYDFTLTRASDLYLKQEVTYREDNKISLTVPEMFYMTNKYSYNILYDEDNDPKYSLSSQLGSRTVAFTRSLTANASVAIDRFIEERVSGRPRQRARLTEADTGRPAWGALFGWLGDDGGAGSDSTAAADEPPQVPEASPATDSEGDGDSEGMRAKITMAVAGAVSPVTLEYRTDEQINYSGLTSRPGLMARIGQETIQPPDSSSVVSSRNTSSRRESYTAGTRLSLPLDIGIRLNAKSNRDEQTTSSVNSLVEGSTVPDITFSMSRVEEKFVVLQRFFTNMNMNSSVAIVKSKTFQNNEPRPTADQYEMRFSPLLSMSAKVLEKYDLSFSLNKTSQEGKNLSGDVISESLTGGMSATTTVKYRITAAQGIPLLRELKLKSDINLTAEHRWESSQTERKVGNEKPALIKDDTSSSLSITADYQFSDRFSGGAEMYFKSSENITKRVHKIREIKIRCQLRF